MDTLAIFLTQLIMSIVVFSLLAKWVVYPWLVNRAAKISMMILIAPHSLRHIGLTFMVPSVTDPEIPQSFAFTTAWGDFSAAILALIALLALKNNWKLAIPLVWIFNLEGFIDLIFALSQAEAVPTLAGTWYIPTFIVPLLLISHIMIFIWLIKGVGKQH
ncbi:MAG: hypothetical protein HRU05_19645 [Oceanospirillaceae bacterium]|nr:hypothetical protein [Oceanospirillaceae bacterium]